MRPDAIVTERLVLRPLGPGPAQALADGDYSGITPGHTWPTEATPIVVGEIYIVSVEDQYSVGVLYRGSYAIPGDTVFFK